MENINEIELFMKKFEDIKEYGPYGVEIWRASNLMKLFGYGKWERFNDIIIRSMGNFNGIVINLCNENGIILTDFPTSGSQSSLFDVNLHYRYEPRVTYSGTNNKVRHEYPDYYLTRLACYAIAMEADNRKPQVKLAKQYLLLSVLENEKRKQQIENIQRISMRETLSDYENSLESTYADHGIRSSQYGYIKSEADKGFYDNPGDTKAVKEELGIPNNKTLYDYMPVETMINKAMANYNTKYGIINKGLIGLQECESEAYLQNKAQREHMYNMQGMYPEETMPAENITITKRDTKKLNHDIVKEIIGCSLPQDLDPRIYTLEFVYAGYSYNLGQWCCMNNVDPNFILSLIDSGIPFEQAIFIRPENVTCPVIITRF